MNVALLLGLIFFIYGVLGMHLFGKVGRGTKEMMQPLSTPAACHLFGCANNGPFAKIRRDGEFLTAHANFESFGRLVAGPKR